MALERDQLLIQINLDSKDANKQIEALADTLQDLRKETDKTSKSTDDLNESIDDSGDEAKKAEKSQKGFSKSLKGSAIALTALNQGLELALKAYRAIKGVVDTTTQAYAVQEKAERDLVNALKIQGQFTNAAIQDFKDFASELQATTTIGDETTLGLLKIAKALGISNEQSKDAVKAAIALAAATGQDVNSAFQQVTKTFGGYAGELGEKLPAIRLLTKEQLEAGEATAVLIKQFGGFAEAARDTFSGQQLAAANAYGDVLEEIGQLFVDVFDLGDSARNLERFFTKIANAIDQFRQKLLFVLDNVDFDRILVPLKEVAKVVGAVLIPVLVKLAIPLGLIAAKVIAISAAIASLIVVIDLLIVNAEPMGKVFTGIGAAIASAFLKGAAAVGEFVNFAIGKLQELIVEGNRIGLIPDKVAVASSEALASLSQSVAGATVAFAKAGEKAAMDAAGAFETVEFQSSRVLDGIRDTTEEVTKVLGSFDQFQDEQVSKLAEMDAARAASNAAIQDAKKKEIELSKQAAEAEKMRAEAAEKEAARAAMQIAELRARTLEQVLNQNAVLAANIKAFDEDEIERAQTFLALQISAIDEEIAKAKELGAIKEKINATTGQKQIVQGKELLDGLEKQKGLLTELTQLEFSTPGQSFARFIKSGIDGLKKVKSGAKSAFDGLMNFEPSSIDLSGMIDGLKGAGEGLLDTLSDPNALADMAGNMIDIGLDVGSAIGGAVMGTVDAVAGAVGDFLDFVFSFDEAALKALKEFPQQFAEALKSLPEFFKELPKVITDVVNTFVDAMPAVVQEVLNAIPAIIDAFIDGAGKIIDMLPGLVAQIAEKLPEFITQILNALPELIEKLFKAIPQIITVLIQAIPKIFIAIVEKLPEIIGAVVEGFIGALGEVIGAFIDTFITKGGALRMAEALVKAIVKLVPILVKAIVNGLARAFKGIFSGFKLPDLDVKPFEKSVKKVVKDASKGAAKVAEEVFGLVDLPGKGDIPQTPEEALNAIEVAIDSAAARLKSLWDQFLEALQRIWQWIWDNILSPIINLVRDAWLWVWNNVIMPIINIVQQAWQWVWNHVIMPIINIVQQAWQWVWNNVIQPITMVVMQAWQWVWNNVIQPIVNVVQQAWGWVKQNIVDPLTNIGEKAFKWVKENIIDKLSLEKINGVFKDVIQVFRNLNFGNISNAFRQVTNTFNKLSSTFDKVLGPFKKLADALNAFNPGNLFGGGGGGIISSRVGGTGGKIISAVSGGFLNQGGLVTGVGFVETPGEFVFSKPAVDAIGAPTLQKINETGKIPGGAGMASVNIESGAIQVNMVEGQSPLDVAETVIEEIRRRSLDGNFVIDSAGIRSA